MLHRPPARSAAPPSKLGDYTVTATLTQKGHADLTAEAVLRVIDPVVSLELKPAEATILDGTNQPYIAEGTTAAGRKVDVTDQTRLHDQRARQVLHRPPRPGQLHRRESGDYTVTGTLRPEGRDDLTDEAILQVSTRWWRA